MLIIIITERVKECVVLLDRTFFRVAEQRFRIGQEEKKKVALSLSLSFGIRESLDGMRDLFSPPFFRSFIIHMMMTITSDL